MNLLDEYWFWCMSAIASPTISNNKYYYDELLDRLFAVTYQGNDILPKFRNAHSSNNPENILLFSEEIKKFQSKDAYIIELPKLPFQVKKDFLEQFIANLGEEFPALKIVLIKELNSFSEKDAFMFKANIKAYPHLYLDYDKMINTFLIKHIHQLYEPIGVSEKSFVLW